VTDVVVEALAALVPGGVVRGELDRGGRKLRWFEVGDGSGPAAVLVAGGGEPALDWVTVLPALAAQTRVIGYDRAGLGASDPAPPVTVPAQLDDLAAVLAEVGPAVLVGHSRGGLLAQLVAFDRPSAVAGLVLVDPAHEEMFASAPWPLRAAEAAVGVCAVGLHRLGLLGAVVRRSARRLVSGVSGDPRTRRLLADAYVASCTGRDHVRTLWAEKRLAGAVIPLARAARAGSALPDVPVVVLSATTGMPPRIRARFTALHAQVAEAAPRGGHVVVAGAGHYIHHDRPEAVVQAVRDVVASSSR